MRGSYFFAIFLSLSSFLLLCHVNGACFVTAVTEESRVSWMLAKFLSFCTPFYYSGCVSQKCLFPSINLVSVWLIQTFLLKFKLSFIVYYLEIGSFVSFSFLHFLEEKERNSEDLIEMAKMEANSTL